ncbi:ABC transporter permease [Halobium palmae]|uniref:ABC transporter permease n=1 Tax=Halobium palmae TaxID=1776492 RepID=A0ABD5RYM2_9EURY
MAHADLTAPETIPEPLQGAVAFVVRWIPLLVLAAGWELVSGWMVPEAVLPGPIAVFAETADLVASGEVFADLFLSVFRVAVGLGASILIGVALGIGMARSEPVENVFDVFLSLLYPIPKTALVPLAILWLGVGTSTAVLIVFLACLLPIVLNSYNAASDVDRNLIWSAQMMGTDGRRLLWKVVFPATIPEIMTGVRQAIPIAFIALVSAELIASNAGIGHLILAAGQIGNYTQMFAAIVVVSATAYAAVRGFEVLESRVMVWA